MTAKVFTTAIVAIPPQEVWPAIQAIRAVNDKHFSRWMPHFTLIYPFWPESRFPEAELTLREALRSLKPTLPR